LIVKNSSHRKMKLTHRDQHWASCADHCYQHPL